jgi:Asp-tRNA(Asn)/Glu-tRNA(Gln) amidotransferase A subunit family amidase
MDLHYKSATEIARLICERKVSAEETLAHFLGRVEKYNAKLNAVIWLDAGRAHERAKAADAALAKGETWGPLHGVPMTIKESFNLAGSPTTWGDPKFADNVTDASALATLRLEKAGAVLFGKTNVPHDATAGPGRDSAGRGRQGAARHRSRLGASRGSSMRRNWSGQRPRRQSRRRAIRQ